MTRLLVRFPPSRRRPRRAFAWIADRPGTIVIRWLNHEIETSVVAGFRRPHPCRAGAMVPVLIAAPPDRHAGHHWRLFALPQGRARGYESLSRGIIAAGAGDGQGRPIALP